MKIRTSLAMILLLLSITAFTFADSVSGFVREISPKERGTILKSVLKNEEASLDFFNKEIKITFPAKSIPENMMRESITVEAVKVVHSSSEFARDFHKRSDIISFTPSMKFSVPVLLRMHYTPELGSDENRYNIFYLNEDSGRFDEMERVSIDMENDVICARVNHFSSYVIGESSYKVCPGISVHARFFANNRESVLDTSGTLILNRQVLSITGRAGLDLILTAEFNSTDFLHTMIAGFPAWDFESMYEEKGYAFATGWHWNLPRIFCKDPKAGDTVTNRSFFYFPGDGRRFELPLASVKDRGVGAEIRTGGCTIFVKEKPASNCYRIVIEIAELKTIIQASVVNPGLKTATLYTPVAYLPDGKIAELASPHDANTYAGCVNTISDASGLNEIQFEYHTDGRIDRITDSLSRIFSFEYNTSDKLESIHYDNKQYCAFTFSGDKLASCSELVQSTAGGDTYQTTTYTYPTTTNLSLAIHYPTGAESTYTFGNLYNSGSTTILSYPGVSIYQNSFTCQPVVKTSTLKENPDTTEYKTITYNYMGGKMYTDSTGTQIGVAYYSLLKENNYTETIAMAWRPWMNYAIKYFSEAIANSSTILATTINGETVSGSPGIFIDSEYCIMRTEVADAQKKTASCFNYASGVLKGVEREIAYVKNGSAWAIDKMTVNTFKDINTYSDYFRINKSTVYHSPTNDINPGTSQYYTGSAFDGYGRTTSTTDPLGNIMQYSYLYPNNMSGTKADGTSYTNTLNKLDLTFKITGKQRSDLEYVVDKETCFYYDDDKRNVMKVTKKKKPYDGSSTTDANTVFSYDPATNNLLSITDPMTNILSLEYESIYNAYVAKDIRTISPAITLDGMTAAKIVNEFGYDNLGRLLTKRTACTDAAGVPIPGYTSETTSYTYDYLDRVTEASTGAGLTKYVYDDSANTLTAYSLVENLGGNTYLAVKSFQQFDGLDRKIEEETSRLSVALDSSNGITELADAVLTSKKACAYHATFLDKVTAAAVYEDAATTAQISETTYDAYARPLQMTSKTSTAAAATLLKQFSYDDATNIITEKNYRDASSFTLKKTKMNWNGNTIAKYEWNTVSPSGDINTALKTAYSFDAFGNMIKMINPSSETFHYYYNTFGRLEKTIYNKGITGVETCELSTYDNNGNPVEFTDRIGNKIIREYNSLGQAVALKTYTATDLVNPETVTTMIYGQFGTPIDIFRTDSAGQQDFEYKYIYNSFGQLATYEQFVGTETDYKHYSITNTYDLAGSLNTTKLWDGEPGVSLIKGLDYDPMAAGNESSVYENTMTGKGELIAKIKNKLWGGIESIEYGASSIMTTNYSYNNLLQPIGITNTDRMSLAYIYDFQDNVTRWTNGTTKTFTYDGLDRLLTETAGTNVDKYFFDAIGNRTAIDKGNNGTTDVTYTYDPVKKIQLNNYTENGQTWTFDYDANGNTTSKTGSAINWEYIYNSCNQLVEVKKDSNTIGQYEYDTNGLRIKKIENSGTTYYIYNGHSILFEETYNTADTLEKSEYNIELNGMNISKYTWDVANGWQLTYHLLDHLSSRQIVCNTNGTIININLYSTFGALEGGNNEEYNFTGKQNDENTGLAYFNARYYDEAIGRFIILDPIKSGVNWYIYAENNPVKFVDKNGLEVSVGYNNLANYRSYGRKLGDISWFGIGKLICHATIIITDSNGNVSYIIESGKNDGKNTQITDGRYTKDRFFEKELAFSNKSGAWEKQFSNGVQDVDPPPGMSQQEFEDAIIAIAASYTGTDKYDALPSDNGESNSNSYVGSILRGSGATGFKPNQWVPGWDIEITTNPNASPTGPYTENYYTNTFNGPIVY